MTTSELLACPDESLRLRAVQAIAQQDAPATVPLLVQALGDASWRVRQAAVEGLTRRGGAEAMGVVLRAMRDDHLNLSVLNGTIQVLAQTGADTLEVLANFLTDPDPGLRTCAALTLGAQGDTRAVPALLPALNDPDPNVRYHVIEALGRLRAGEAVDALTAVAESRDFSLAFPALDALTSIGDARIAYRLVPLLEDELLQTATVAALGQVGDEEVVAPLVRLLNMPAAPAGTVARALARLHDRHESLDRKDGYVAGLVRQLITPPGVQNLLDVLNGNDGTDLQAVALVLGWLEGEALERALTRLLGRPDARAEVIEALVRKGPAVTDLLIDQLGADDLETRQAAVVALGRIGDPRAVPALLEALSADEQLMVSIAGALAMIGDPGAYAPLLGLLNHGDATVRRAAVSALNSLGHPDTAADMATLLRDPRPLVRESAVRVAGYSGYPACADLLLECCRDRNETVRRAAVESLPCQEDPRVLPALRQALHDEASSVRAAAARALGLIDGADTWPLLQGALGDAAPWVRYFATRSVGRQQHTQALPALTRLAQSDEAMQVRVAAVEAIGSIGGAGALPVLIALAGVADGDLARAALAALGATGHPEALAPLLAALDAPEPTRRIEALHALGQSRRAEAVGPLQIAATDPNADVALAAIAALGQLAVPEAVDALIVLTLVPARRDACVAALASAGKAQIDRVARGLSHEHIDVRRAVVDALARMKDPCAAQVLEVALGDAEGSVRLAAIAALAQSGNPQREPQLAALARTDPDLSVRWAAQTRLRR